MDSIKIAGLPEVNVAEALQSTKLAKDQAPDDIRSLGDWEMVLVAGGDGIPCWP